MPRSPAWIAAASSDPSVRWAPSATMHEPTLMSDSAPAAPFTWYFVLPLTWIVADVPPGWVTVMVSPLMAVTWPPVVGRTTLIAVTVYVPSAARFWANTIWSPTARSDTAIVAPPLVMVVVLVTEMVRVQPSSVFSARSEPLIAVIVMSRAPSRPKAPGP